MREMTTAEFAKANLAALEEPVAVRRYTKTVGIYYPEGYAPGEPPAAPAPVLFDIPEPSAAAALLDSKDEEIRRLKQELAARAKPALAPTPMTTRAISGDPFAGLAKQDREFFDRKLGKGKKG